MSDERFKLSMNTLWIDLKKSMTAIMCKIDFLMLYNLHYSQVFEFYDHKCVEKEYVLSCSV